MDDHAVEGFTELVSPGEFKQVLDKLRDGSIDRDQIRRAIEAADIKPMFFPPRDQWSGD